MASCEKCWNDARKRALTIPSRKTVEEHYQDVLKERALTPCTPEERAGNNAFFCPNCERKTIHPATKRCENCGVGLNEAEEMRDQKGTDQSIAFGEWLLKNAISYHPAKPTFWIYQNDKYSTAQLFKIFKKIGKMKKSKFELQQLKESWLSDPVWDIEESEGFEEHKEELLQFRKQCERAWKIKRKARRKFKHSAAGYSSKEGDNAFPIAFNEEEHEIYAGLSKLEYFVALRLSNQPIKLNAPLREAYIRQIISESALAVRCCELFNDLTKEEEFLILRSEV
jgi:ribosomal protein L37E